MDDFNKRFRQQQDEFDRDWERTRRWLWVSAVINTAIGLALIGFCIWVVVMIMRYFGVI